MSNDILLDMDRKKDSEILAKRSLQIQRGGARAAVLGVNDGLVSTLCLVLGVAGAGAAAHSVLLAGFAGVIAGAVSMAAGEWISVRSQVELFSGVLSDLNRLMKDDRGLLRDQVAESLASTGHMETTAKAAAKEIAADDGHLAGAYARQVMGFNPNELGSPWVAAISSFALFSVGALAPLGPWLFTGGMSAIWMSIIFTAIGGFVVGGYISKSSGKNVLHGAFRQFGIVLLASAVTYGIGFVFGTAV